MQGLGLQRRQNVYLVILLLIFQLPFRRFGLTNVSEVLFKEYNNRIKESCEILFHVQVNGNYIRMNAVKW